MGLFRRGTTVYVCRKCKEEVAKDAKRCPHCGWAPEDEKKSALYKATALIPAIGALTGAKSLRGDIRSTRSLAVKKRVKKSGEETKPGEMAPGKKGRQEGREPEEVEKSAIEYHRSKIPSPNAKEKDPDEMDDYERKLYEVVHEKSED